MATDIKKLAEELVNMTVLEVNELKTLLKDEYGIEPVAAVAVAAGGADAGAADEGKSEFNVVLKHLEDDTDKLASTMSESTVMAAAFSTLRLIVIVECRVVLNNIMCSIHQSIAKSRRTALGHTSVLSRELS